MAKKRKKHHTTHHRRRRVGASPLGKLGSGTGLKLLAVAGGYLLADTLNNFAFQYARTTTPATATTPATSVPMTNTVMLGEIGLGGLLLLSKKKSMPLTIAGGILAGAGLKLALKKTGIISGYQSVPVIGANRHRMAGYQSVPVLGNAGVPPQLAGKLPGQLQGFRVNGYGSQGSGVMNGAGQGSGLMKESTGYMQ